MFRKGNTLFNSRMSSENTIKPKKMDKTTRLKEQWYSFYSTHGKHQYINELGNAYFDEGYVDTVEDGFDKAQTYLELQLASNLTTNING